MTYYIDARSTGNHFLISEEKPKRIDSEQGSTLVEMALALPATLTFLFGLFYFCLVLFGYGGAVFGTRAATRYGALHSSASLNPATTSSISNSAKSYIFAAPSGGISVNVAYSSSGNVIGGTVQVTTVLNFTPAIPFMKGPTITVGSSAQRTITR